MFSLLSLFFVWKPKALTLERSSNFFVQWCLKCNTLVRERNDLKRLNAKPCFALEAAVSLEDPVGRKGTYMGHDDTYSVAQKT